MPMKLSAVPSPARHGVYYFRWPLPSPDRGKAVGPKRFGHACSPTQRHQQEMEGLSDRIINASSPPVIGAYEKRIEKLKCQKIRLAEQAESAVPAQRRLGEFIDMAFGFLLRL